MKHHTVHPAFRYIFSFHAKLHITAAALLPRQLHTIDCVESEVDGAAGE